MAQRRMISKSISVSRKLAQVSQFSALIFTWLIPHCDDGGNMAGDAFTIKGLVIPMRPESVKEIEVSVKELAAIGLIDMYDINGEKFLHIVGWENHQTLRADRATWEYPSYPKGVGNQLATSRQARAAEGKVREGKVSKDKDYSADFETFWTLYPRKVGKPKAWQVWERIEPNKALTEKIMAGLGRYLTSDQWTKDDGRFIPHPTTWMNREGWNDEVKAVRPGMAIPGKYSKVKIITA